MNCEDYGVLMNMVIDGEASPEDEWLLSEHLKVCRACRDEYARLNAVALQMRQMQEDVPECLHSRIMSGIKGKKPVRIPMIRVKTIAMVAAACLVIAAAGVFMPSMSNFFATKDDVFAEANYSGSNAVDSAPQSPTSIEKYYAADGDYGYIAEKNNSDNAQPSDDSADSSDGSDPSKPDKVDSATTSGHFVQSGVYVLEGNGVLPAQLDAYQPVYLNGEVVFCFDDAGQAKIAYSALVDNGFSKLSEYQLSDECMKLAGQCQTAVIVILK
ncbi:MAG: zf-HC2 domain-containing protein [Clostridia bacterium]|nr:zf-HC2 domain-containing protein [Clostridia bacterium]